VRERGARNLHRYYAVSQIEYYRNFIFKRYFPIRRIFERSCEIGLFRLTAHNRTPDLGQVRLEARPCQSVRDGGLADRHRNEPPCCCGVTGSGRAF
jgi:hypothetical protein